MRRFYLLGFLLLLSFDTVAQLCLKFVGDQALPLEMSTAWVARVLGEPWILGALAGYIGAFFTWMTLLKHAPIGPAFAASHLEIVTVMGASALIFGERLHGAQLVGAALILLGIVVLAMSESEDAAHAGQLLREEPDADVEAGSASASTSTATATSASAAASPSASASDPAGSRA
ncbi:DMT family transporter [Mitsuaria sp. GD03876]|uniref:DMT family transporter n=1 Tax=Mitsuaria sp. GD03876 TaxID=2975399 RepID=UPI00244780D3|nr:DMT family transporter [Mitsuaria sp. GD03876]MDH0865364.1 DMT family transporter [Mitsuaria sp. GD03876]